ncbi:MAG: PPOX class F420-dependent oxidoreductase [Thermoflexales bacterium]|nr:PPOX class F420-dependent oxidoreductase [Thermoflexales bacterium]
MKTDQFINLETYRKSGAAVVTPVWFVERGDKRYVRTWVGAGKAKRLRNNPAARIQPCGRRGEPMGEWRSVNGRLLDSPQSLALAEDFRRKYGLMTRFFDVLNALRRAQWQGIELTNVDAAI